jgi:hypothetical protein
MSADRPSRAYVLNVYTKRFLRWQRTSYPYISGDAFARLADFRFSPVSWRYSDKNKVYISDARIIFCKGEELDAMLRDVPGIKAKVIICGNSDYEFHKPPSAIPSSVRALFLQNSFISDNKNIFTLPIGLENIRWGVNGHPKLLKKISSTGMEDKILFGPFGKTHQIRNEIFNNFSQATGPWDVLPPKRITASEYSLIAGNYRFIAAVQGNGIDTHRLWESLYRGSIPLVKDDAWSRSLSALALPMIRVEDWSTELIRQSFASFPKDSVDPAQVDSLWMPFWEKKISAFLS